MTEYDALARENARLERENSALRAEAERVTHRVSTAWRMILALIILIAVIVGGGFASSVTVNAAAGRAETAAKDAAANAETVATIQQEILAEQAAGKIRGYKTRAVGCRLSRDQEVVFTEGDPCLDPEVLWFYWPDHPDATNPEAV